jgi:hypothetical protein
MNKTERLVILIEPDLLKKVKKAAQENIQTVSDFVRTSLLYFIHDQSAGKRFRRLKKIGRYQMPLKNIEDPKKLKKMLEGNYRHV